MKDEQRGEYSTFVFFSSLRVKKGVIARNAHLSNLNTRAAELLHSCSPPRKGKKKGR